MNRKTIGLAMCGSFCTFARVLDAFSALDREQYDLVPIQSQAAYATDTRFGAAAASGTESRPLLRLRFAFS